GALERRGPHASAPVLPTKVASLRQGRLRSPRCVGHRRRQKRTLRLSIAQTGGLRCQNEGRTDASGGQGSRSGGGDMQERTRPVFARRKPRDGNILLELGGECDLATVDELRRCARSSSRSR